MAEWRGGVQGQHGEVTRLGSKNSGIRGWINSWRVMVEIECHTKSDGTRTWAVTARNYDTGRHLITLFEGTEADLLAKLERDA